MPKRSTPFQKLVRQIEAALHGSARVTESALLTDAVTGGEREVDVLIEDQAGPRTVRIAVEVTEEKRKAGSPWVEHKIGRTSDLRPHVNHLVLVSKAGFTRPALLKAEAAGVETLTLDAAAELDWTRFVGKAKHLMVGRKWFDVLRLNPRVECDGPLPSAPVPDSITLFDNEGRSRGTVHELVEQVLFPQLDRMADREKWRDGDVVDIQADLEEPALLLAHGRWCRFQVLRARIRFHLALAELEMEAASYRHVPVGHAVASSTFGELRLTVLEEPGSPMIRGSLEIEDASGQVERMDLDFEPPETSR